MNSAMKNVTKCLITTGIYGFSLFFLPNPKKKIVTEIDCRNKNIKQKMWYINDNKFSIRKEFI